MTAPVHFTHGLSLRLSCLCQQAVQLGLQLVRALFHATTHMYSIR